MLLYAISGHFVFNMNKTVPPASFIRRVWRHSKDPTGAAQRLFIADRGFSTLFIMPAQSPQRHSVDLVVHLKCIFCR